MLRHTARNALVVILACIACAASAAAIDDRYATTRFGWSSTNKACARTPKTSVRAWPNQSSGKGEIQVGGVTLALERGANYWTVTSR